jgi:hypothetical protein
MSIEDRVRAAMRAHEHEAPTAADFSASRGLPTTTHRRHTAWLAGAATAACVLVIAGVVAIVRPTSDKAAPSPAANAPVSSALACPQRYEWKATPWVPGPPTVAGAASRLVPNRTPAHVVVCAYLPHPGTQDGTRPALTGRTELRGDLAAVRTTLTWLPERVTGQQQPCPTYIARTDGENYLIGLSYRGGTVWVSAPGNHCELASNGPFTTMLNLRPWAAAAYSSGVWVLDPPRPDRPRDPDPCDMTLGRLGQDSAMVPTGATSVQICVALGSGPHAGYRTVTNSGAASPLARVLNRLPTRVSTSACVSRGLLRHEPYDLLFRYADGPPVHVRVDAQCRPSIDNGSLQAVDAESVVPLIEQALGRH